MREQFEKLEEIAKVLRVFDVIFDGENYSAKGNHSEVKKVYALGFVNGAWYAYQEQWERFNNLRRPELDSDTCSDIRNHISPLTKVIDR